MVVEHLWDVAAVAIISGACMVHMFILAVGAKCGDMWGGGVISVFQQKRQLMWH